MFQSKDNQSFHFLCVDVHAPISQVRLNLNAKLQPTAMSIYKNSPGPYSIFHYRMASLTKHQNQPIKCVHVVLIYATRLD